MRDLPDFEITTREAKEFIFDSLLAQKALATPFISSLANMVRDLLDLVSRLVDSCHLPEFTDHGLPHICSLIKRISDWGECDGWLLRLKRELCGKLLISTIIHDLGMLSQNPLHVKDPNIPPPKQGEFVDATWVRRTHGDRLDSLLKESVKDIKSWKIFLSEKRYNDFRVVVELAKSHNYWPHTWQDNFPGTLGIASPQNRGLAAVIAVADLLDEDATRCDTVTLIRHRLANDMNHSHWLRHVLTKERVNIHSEIIHVNFKALPGYRASLEKVFIGLRNQYKLTLLYKSELSHIGANIKEIKFYPDSEEPPVNENDTDYEKFCGLFQEKPELKINLEEKLLHSLLSEAREFVGPNFQNIDLKQIDLSSYRNYAKGLITEEERTVNGFLNQSK